MHDFQLETNKHICEGGTTFKDKQGYVWVMIEKTPTWQTVEITLSDMISSHMKATENKLWYSAECKCHSQVGSFD